MKNTDTKKIQKIFEYYEDVFDVIYSRLVFNDGIMYYVENVGINSCPKNQKLLYQNSFHMFMLVAKECTTKRKEIKSKVKGIKQKTWEEYYEDNLYRKPMWLNDKEEEEEEEDTAIYVEDKDLTQHQRDENEKHFQKNRKIYVESLNNPPEGCTYLVENVSIIRDKYIAHFDYDYLGGKEKALKFNPCCRTTLIKEARDLMVWFYKLQNCFKVNSEDFYKFEITEFFK